MYTVEFQKRGLPHAHMLLWLYAESNLQSVDEFICVELPNPQKFPTLYNVVTKYMIYRPCGRLRPSSYCLKDGKYSKFYPKRFIDQTRFDEDGYSIYKCRNMDVTVKINDVDIDNRFVVPYNPLLLMKYLAHINLEFYPDRVTVTVGDTNQSAQYSQVVDKIKQYYDCCYLSPSESMWRIFAYDIHHRWPSVQRLTFHLPIQQHVVFDDADIITHVYLSNKDLVIIFTSWMIANRWFPEGRVLTYVEYPSKFVYCSNCREWKPRQRGFSIRRLSFAHSSSGELFYMRMLLNVQRRSAIFRSNNESRRVANIFLLKIEKLLQNNGKSLRNYAGMPLPNTSLASQFSNLMLLHELQYDTVSLLREHDENILKLNEEQRVIYDKIIDCVSNKRHGFFFVYGFGGTGKIFLYRVLSARLRSEKKIVINVASSGIASLLLPGEKTAHSMFNIPVELTEDTICRIKKDSPKDKLIRLADLIIWDEAPTTNKLTFKELDRTLHDIMVLVSDSNKNLPFGGKVFVLGGDFRQVLPVIPKGSRAEIVMASINSSVLWKYCEVLRLTKNLRLANGLEQSTAQELSFFQDKAILAPTVENVEEINSYIVDLLPGEEKNYLSADSICGSDAYSNVDVDWINVEFLNQIRCSGLPNHSLKLKIGVPIILLRNIDSTSAKIYQKIWTHHLCNGTRLVVRDLGKNVICAEVISGSSTGDKVFITRMTLIPSDTVIPLKFQRRQFPVSLSFKLSIVGLFLRRPVFSHGQLYVAFSRVSNRNDLKILLCDEGLIDSARTENV
ncbi:hypothetical protein AAHE18_12G116100, partial [Arachis hypogaea]